MTRPAATLATAIAVALFGAMPGIAAAGVDLAQARAFTDQHQYPQAIAAFDQLLAERPDDADLAIERARVLGFADRNADAAAAYADVASRHPERRKDVLSSWAWQTLWAGEPAQADPLFRERLAADPSDARARLGLAQSLLWSGQELAAVVEYDRVLQSDPTSHEALAGRALALNFGGRSREAARSYAKLLPTDDAGLRLQAARAYYWAGFPDLAAPLLANAALPEAVLLRDFRVHREVAPAFVSGSFDASTDADDLDVLTFSAAGGHRVGNHGTLEASVRTSTLDGDDTSRPGLQREEVRTMQALAAWSGRFGSIDGAHGTLWPMLALGGREVEGWNGLAWKGRLRYALDDTWTLTAYAGNGVPETIGAIRNEINYDELTLGVDALVTPRWRASGALTRLAYSRGNDRSQVSARVEYLAVPRRQLRLGLEAVRFQNSEPDGPSQPNLGYWNPDSYSEERLYASIGGERGPWSYEARASAGYFQERDGWGNTTTDPTFAGSASIAYDFSPRLQLRAYAGGSRSGAGIGSGGAGYHRSYAGISLTGYFGGR